MKTVCETYGTNKSTRLCQRKTSTLLILITGIDASGIKIFNGVFLLLDINHMHVHAEYRSYSHSLKMML